MVKEIQAGYFQDYKWNRYVREREREHTNNDFSDFQVKNNKPEEILWPGQFQHSLMGGGAEEK